MGSQACFGVIFVLSMALLLVQIDVSHSSNATEAANVTTPTVKSNITEATVPVKNATVAPTKAHNATVAPTVATTAKAGVEGVFSSMVIVSYAFCLTVAANM